MRFKELKKIGGFTLIEILIVVAITSLLSGVVLTYSSKGRTQVALYVESAKLSQTILRAKSLAIATYGESETPCGYGVHIDYNAKTYSLFSYKPPDCGTISSGPIDTTNLTYPGAYTVKSGEVYNLPQGMEYDGSGSPLSDILFLPPDPAIDIWTREDLLGPSNNPSSVVIINSADQASRITVKVTPGGQVTF
jgi:prepilin-type N-terminal cleavage/methylation domain-containing protein